MFFTIKIRGGKTFLGFLFSSMIFMFSCYNKNGSESAIHTSNYRYKKNPLSRFKKRDAGFHFHIHLKGVFHAITKIADKVNKAIDKIPVLHNLEGAALARAGLPPNAIDNAVSGLDQVDKVVENKTNDVKRILQKAKVAKDHVDSHPFHLLYLDRQKMLKETIIITSLQRSLRRENKDDSVLITTFDTMRKNLTEYKNLLDKLDKLSKDHPDHPGISVYMYSLLDPSLPMHEKSHENIITKKGKVSSNIVHKLPERFGEKILNNLRKGRIPDNAQADLNTITAQIDSLSKSINQQIITYKLRFADYEKKVHAGTKIDGKIGEKETDKGTKIDGEIREKETDKGTKVDGEIREKETDEGTIIDGEIKEEEIVENDKKIRR